MFASLKKLDLSNNPFTNYEALSLALATIPQLKELRIDLIGENSLTSLLKHLPRLEKLNETPLQPSDGIINKIDIADDYIDKYNLVSEIPKYNEILNSVIQCVPNSNINALFKENITMNIEKADSIIRHDIPNYYYLLQIQKMKLDLYYSLQKEVIKMMSLTGKTDSNLIQILLKINAEMMNKRDEMMEIISMTEESIAHHYKYCSDLHHENEALKYTIRQRNKENNLLEQSNKMLLSKNAIINKENYLMTNKLLVVAKNITNNSKNEERKNEVLKSDSKIKSTKSVMTPVVCCRQQTKESLLELISEIYKSKLSCNEKNREINHPLETMEQHMYRYLNTKYGLKNITIEVVSSIVEGIKKYSQSNAEICLFGLILRNEVEENSIQILQRIKTIISDLLFYFLRQRSQFKTYEDTNREKEKMLNGFIDEDLWNNIINVIFQNDEKNGEIVRNRVYNFIDRKLNHSFSKIDMSNILTREKDLIEEVKNYQKKIACADLFNILLDFHIRTRSKYLSKFKEIFDKHDSNKDGILTINEFSSLIMNMKIFDKNILNAKINEIIRKLPHCEEYNSFSFDEAVSFFEKETDESGISLLEKFTQ